MCIYIYIYIASLHQPASIVRFHQSACIKPLGPRPTFLLVSSSPTFLEVPALRTPTGGPCKDVVAQRLHEAVSYVDWSMACAKLQIQGGRKFIFEHPAGASSWTLLSVQEVRNMKGVQEVILDQCMLGLCTKVDKVPTRKRTRLLTNSSVVIQKFSGLLCDRSHEHRIIEVVEGGIKRSRYAQQYPSRMVELIVACAAAEL